jgi:hypothetical protein
MTVDEFFVSRRVVLDAENSNQHAAECRECLEYSAGTSCSRCGVVSQARFFGRDVIHELEQSVYVLPDLVMVTCVLSEHRHNLRRLSEYRRQRSSVDVGIVGCVVSPMPPVVAVLDWPSHVSGARECVHPSRGRRTAVARAPGRG